MASFEKFSNAILTGQSARWLIYPAPTGVPAVGVTLTSGAGAWGAAADIVAAAAIATQIFIGAVLYDTGGAAQIFEIMLGQATPTTNTWFEDRINPTAVTINQTGTKLPYPVWQPAGQQLQGKAGGAAAKTINVSLMYSVAL